MTAPAGSMGYYLWRAFTSPGNLLAVFGGAAAAMLTPWPDVLLPLVGAGEAIYLGALVSLPRYREAIDAQTADRERGHVAAVNVYPPLINLRTHAPQPFNAPKKSCPPQRSLPRATRPPTV